MCLDKSPPFLHILGHGMEILLGKTKNQRFWKQSSVSEEIFFQKATPLCPLWDQILKIDAKTCQNVFLIGANKNGISRHKPWRAMLKIEPKMSAFRH